MAVTADDATASAAEGWSESTSLLASMSEILHLCHEVGVPVVWPPAMFAARPRYATLIGLKRVTARERPKAP